MTATRGLPLVALLVALLAPAASAEPDQPWPDGFKRIHVVDFEGEIGQVTEAYMRRCLAAAKEQGADCIVLRIDSPGGLVSSTLEIGDALTGLPESIHTVAWIPERAYSGAAMTAIACREILMLPRAHMGDAQPILMDGEGGYKPAGEKAESPLRAKVRAYAEQNGYPPLLAETLVTPAEILRVRSRDGRTWLVRGADFRGATDEVEVVGGWKKRDLVQVGTPLTTEGRLLTMTGKEARDFGFLGRRFVPTDYPTDEAAVLSALKAPDGVVEYFEMSFSERMSRLLLGIAPVLSALVMVALLSLLFQGPGILTFVGACALGLVLLIEATAGLVQGFPILLLVVGALLLLAEVFIIPGFTIAGILGIGTMAAGFLLLAVGATIGDAGGLNGESILDFSWKFVATLVVGLAGLVVLSRFFPQVGPGRRMLLAAPAASPTAAVTAAPPARPGDVGVAISPLRPAGTAEFEGRLTDVVSDGEYVDPGSRVRVVRVEGPTVTVLPVPDAGDPT